MDDLFQEYDSQGENEDDIPDLVSDNFSNVAISGTDWTAETIITQIDKGNIFLNPSFQRRDAWDLKRKSKFIESLVLGLPVPQIVLAESKENRGQYLVLDGKQRLLSIRQFSASKTDSNYVQLSLKSLEIRPDLNGQNFISLKESPRYSRELSAFENQPIRTVVIKNWPSEDFLYHVFLRLNTGSVPLSPQELRQALHPGPFVDCIDISSCQSTALSEILKLNKPDFRMRDAELLLRYIAFKNYLKLYSGSLKSFLDQACERLNNEWPKKEGLIRGQIIELERAHTLIKGIFGENSYHKWNGKKYENRFNRAIFDILILAFTLEPYVSVATQKTAEVEKAFRTLCEDPVFLTSIESTTKSLDATVTRISKWFDVLNKVYGLNVPLPKLVDSRIV
ncbi:DUF262 domain-containing protein [Roseibacillus persicicus]|uniref:DUF262 domain-containing protein n=1 Tax=Roseibacillus persicicus TaxID=454148 RepID=UPI00280F0B08|nr:DUF262 domain-containing protein [Roseibacillus persicicus]MDQ8190071.1 DUF262 domain-containing protein [Roseibacillus persicicus]